MRGSITAVGLTLIATQATATSCTTSEGGRGPDVVPEVTQAETELADVEGAEAVEVSLVHLSNTDAIRKWALCMAADVLPTLSPRSLKKKCQNLKLSLFLIGFCVIYTDFSCRMWGMWR